jgi:hypothetical protein
MKKLFFAAAILGLLFLLVGCGSNSNPQTNPTPANVPGNNQPAARSTTGAATLDQSTPATLLGQSSPATAVPDQSSAAQAEQTLNDLQNTLQSTDTNQSTGTDVNSTDTTEIYQSLNSLQDSLTATDVPNQATSSTTLDQDLSSLQQALQAQTTP